MLMRVRCVKFYLSYPHNLHFEFLILFQFIVVSLKDGMFNNANVLYKTKFVDGVSTVTRYVQNTSRLHDGKENNSAIASKKKQGGGNKRARLEEI